MKIEKTAALRLSEKRQGSCPEWHFQLLVVRAERMADAARSGLLFPERLGYD